MPHTWIGIDPGLKGAIGVVGEQGQMLTLWDMPTKRTHARSRSVQVDVAALDAIFRLLPQYPNPIVRLEWPTTRPDESAEASKNFGVGLGNLEALCHAHRLELDKVAPNKWKGDLGLPGKKKNRDAGRLACAFCLQWVVDVPESLVFGPRGGPLDGRAEALLIAWHGWSRTLAAMRTLRDRFGKDAVELHAFALLAGSGRRGHRSIKNLPA